MKLEVIHSASQKDNWVEAEISLNQKSDCSAVYKIAVSVV